jgi:hypothetical protein
MLIYKPKLTYGKLLRRRQYAYLNTFNISIALFILLKYFSGLIFALLMGTSCTHCEPISYIVVVVMSVLCLFILMNWKVQCDLFSFYTMQRELLLGGGEESTVRRRNLQYVICAIFSLC